MALRTYCAWACACFVILLGQAAPAIETGSAGHDTRSAPAQSSKGTPSASPSPKSISKEPYKQRLKWSAQIIPRYFVGSNDINLTVIHPETGARSSDHYLAPITDSHYESVYLFAGLTFPYQFANQSGSVYAHFDTGEIYRGTISSINENSGETTTQDSLLSNGNTIDDEFKEHAFIRQLFLSHTFGHHSYSTVKVGRGNPVVGYSLIYNDYSPFVELKLESKNAWAVPVELTILGVSPSDELTPSNNLIASAEFAIPHPRLGRFSVFTAKLWDEDNALSEGFRDAITASISTRNNAMNSVLTGRVGLFNRLTTFDSDSEVNWLGTGYLKTWANSNQIWFNGVMSAGRASISMDMTRFLRSLRQLTRNRDLDIEETVDVDLVLTGYAMQAGGTVYVSKSWYASCFGLVMSGDDGLDGLAQAFSPGSQTNAFSDRFSAFLSIVPYLGHTNIFFNGGLDQGFSNRQAAVGGLAGKGIMAGGISLAGPIWGKLSYQGGPTLLNAMHTGPYGRGDVYGIEFDNGMSYALSETTSIDAQVDVFRTGDFFAQQVWNTQTTVQFSYSPSGQL